MRQRVETIHHRQSVDAAQFRITEQRQPSGIRRDHDPLCDLGDRVGRAFPERGEGSEVVAARGMSGHQRTRVALGSDFALRDEHQAFRGLQTCNILGAGG